MKDLSLLAKLLAEEDIHVVHRQQPTAMFDVLNRELSLPIWKDMSKNIQDLMTLHEAAIENSSANQSLPSKRVSKTSKSLLLSF